MNRLNRERKEKQRERKERQLFERERVRNEKSVLLNDQEPQEVTVNESESPLKRKFVVLK